MEFALEYDKSRSNSLEEAPKGGSLQSERSGRRLRGRKALGILKAKEASKGKSIVGKPSHVVSFEVPWAIRSILGELGTLLVTPGNETDSGGVRRRSDRGSDSSLRSISKSKTKKYSTSRGRVHGATRLNFESFFGLDEFYIDDWLYPLQVPRGPTRANEVMLGEDAGIVVGRIAPNMGSLLAGFRARGHEACLGRLTPPLTTEVLGIINLARHDGHFCLVDRGSCLMGMLRVLPLQEEFPYLVGYLLTEKDSQVQTTGSSGNEEQTSSGFPEMGPNGEAYTGPRIDVDVSALALDLFGHQRFLLRYVLQAKSGLEDATVDESSLSPEGSDSLPSDLDASLENLDSLNASIEGLKRGVKERSSSRIWKGRMMMHGCLCLLHPTT
ncbi:hypothetical protein ACFE04_026621 [Oxalis oulophora]